MSLLHSRTSPPGRYIRIATVIALLLLANLVRAEMWRVPVTVTNADDVEGTVEFGIHPEATEGMDPQLGEVNLPPWPPQQVFDVRFLVPGYQGFALDLRDTIQTSRTYDLKWQVGNGGYPVTVQWDRTRFGTGSFTASDVFGGMFVPPTNMAEESLIVIPASQNFVRELVIEVVPQLPSPQPPDLRAIPEQQVFTGQRFPYLRLADFVDDPDTPPEQLVWSTAAELPLMAEVDAEGILEVGYPDEWAGSGIVALLVQDPEGNSDSVAIGYRTLPGGVVSWSVPLHVQDNSGGAETLHFGVDPSATSGIDSTLGEIGLPPPPPAGVFDTRFELGSYVSSRIDIRPSTESPRTHTLRWQPNDNGYPVTISWDSAGLPIGSFQISDELGGIIFPPVNMSEFSQILVPESLSVVTAFLIDITPAVDSNPPTTPGDLQVLMADSGNATLVWDPSTDDYFAYYEVLIDTFPFSEGAQWVWDWSDDSTLVNPFSMVTAVRYPNTEVQTFFFRVRAWDQFGNHSVVSNLAGVHLPTVQHLRCRRAGADIRLFWSPVRWASEYQVYRGDNPDVTPVNGLMVGTVSDTTFVEPLIPGTTAFYVVTATFD